MTRMTISLGDQEKKALRSLAEKEFRDPRAQAALIIRQELERCGLLVSEQNLESAGKASQGGTNVPG